MSIVVYLPETFKGHQRAQKMIRTLKGMTRTEICVDMDALFLRIGRFAEKPLVLTLFAGSYDELKRFVDRRQLFWNIPLVVVVPDRDARTTALGYALFPRFLTHEDGDLTETEAVIAKMFRYLENRPA